MVHARLECMTGMQSEAVPNRSDVNTISFMQRLLFHGAMCETLYVGQGPLYLEVMPRNAESLCHPRNHTASERSETRAVTGLLNCLQRSSIGIGGSSIRPGDVLATTAKSPLQVFLGTKNLIFDRRF